MDFVNAALVRIAQHTRTEFIDNNNNYAIDVNELNIYTVYFYVYCTWKVRISFECILNVERAPKKKNKIK
jgi:hypothetical protein